MLDEISTRLLEMANQMASPDKVKAKAAKGEMERIVHDTARPGAKKDDRVNAASALLTVVQDGKAYSRMARAHAVRLLGFIGGRNEERALGPLERDPEIGEDTRMARERIRKG